MSVIFVDPKTAADGNRGFRSRWVLVVATGLLLSGLGLGLWHISTLDKQPQNTAVKAPQDKQYKQTKADLEQKVKSAKTPAEKSAAYQGLANLEIENGNKQAAEQQAEQAVKSDDKSYEAYAVLAMVRMQNGDNDGAIAAYKKAAELARAAGQELGAKDYEIMAASVGK
jgi:cytochrome c-type biogenesis protein CcmH/NrfG